MPPILVETTTHLRRLRSLCMCLCVFPGEKWQTVKEFFWSSFLNFQDLERNITFGSRKHLRTESACVVKWSGIAVVLFVNWVTARWVDLCTLSKSWLPVMFDSKTAECGFSGVKSPYRKVCAGKYFTYFLPYFIVHTAYVLENYLPAKQKMILSYLTLI